MFRTFQQTNRICNFREVIIQGLQTVVRLVRHHTKDIQGGVTHSFVVPLTKHIKNLRSQVSRGACQCARELFMTLGKHMDSVSPCTTIVKLNFETASEFERSINLIFTCLQLFFYFCALLFPPYLGLTLKTNTSPTICPLIRK